MVKEAAALAVSAMSPNEHAKDVITADGGVNKLIATYHTAGTTDIMKHAIKLSLRQLATHPEGKREMLGLGILERATHTDPFPGLQ